MAADPAPPAERELVHSRQLQGVRAIIKVRSLLHDVAIRIVVAPALDTLRKGVVGKEIEALPPAHVVVDLKRVIPGRSAVQTLPQQVTAELWERSCELEARQSRRTIKRCPEERRLLIERIGQLCV